MDVLQGNMFFLLSTLAIIPFSTIYGHYYDTVFQLNFDYYRKRLLHQEIVLVVKLTAGISIFCILLYYFLCNRMNYDGISPVHTSYIILWMLSFYLMLSLSSQHPTHRVRVMAILLITCFFWGIPFACIVNIFVFHIYLDLYLIYFTAFLLLLDIILGHRVLHCWKRGDL